jgi:hypothetical protein
MACDIFIASLLKKLFISYSIQGDQIGYFGSVKSGFRPFAPFVAVFGAVVQFLLHK